MIEISENKYVVASKIVGMRIYTKDGKTGIAISLDTINPDEKTAFAGPFKDADEAKHAIHVMAEKIGK